MLTLAWRAARWTAPLAASLATGKGAIAMRSGWYLACEADGNVGLGEAVAWPAWGTEDEGTMAGMLAAWPVVGMAPAGLADIAACLRERGLDPVRTPALWAGAELALLDWLARRQGVSLAALLADGGPVHAAVPVAALIGADAPEVAAAAARAAVAAGHGTVKLKATGEADLARVAAVRAAIGPGVGLRLDANEAWGEASEPLLAAVAPFAPEFVEQPVPAADRAGLARLAAGPVPVAADEALGFPGAAAELLAAGLKVFVAKPLVTGGLLAARELVQAARAAGARVVLSSALDRGVGTAGALHLAAACGDLPPAGLGTAGWWADGGALAGLLPVDGRVAVPAGPGLGYAVTDPALMALVAPPPGAGLAGLPKDGLIPQSPGMGGGGEPGVGVAPPEVITHPRPLATPALEGGGTTYTHGELDALALDGAARLVARGVAPGDVVALWGPPSPAWVIAARAAWRLGAAVLPLPPRWTDAEAADVLRRAAPQLVLGPDDLAARAAALGHPATTFDDLAAGPAGAAPPLPSSDRLAAIVPTSGTTGRPKLAGLTAAGLAATADATAAVLGLRPGDVYWLPLPLHHVGGLGAVWRAWRAGAALRLGGEVDGATHASLVPTQLLDLADAAWPAGLRAVMVGGAAPPADLAARCPAAFATYGLTEGGGTVTLSPAAEAEGTAGRPLPGWEIAILDADGRPLPPGAEGAIAVRGPGTMAGYLDDPIATAQALGHPSLLPGGGEVRRSRDEGERGTPGEPPHPASGHLLPHRGEGEGCAWLRTGDLGLLDPAGRLVVLGRRDDLVVSGGENVYPAEVEAALRAHPAIADAAVVPASDPRWGQVPVAFATAHPGAELPDLPALRAFLGERLARFKHPQALTWLPALPRLSSGKVDRRLLRDRAAEVRV